MSRRKLLSMALKDLKRKSSIAVMILLSISSTFLFIILRWNFIYTLSDEYFDRKYWPAEIEIYNGYENESGVPIDLGSIVDDIRGIEGVKWVVYPGGGISIGYALNYSGKNYYLVIHWCNVEDPTFPHPKFMVEGRFFRSNEEKALIIEMPGKKLLEDLGLYQGIGTKVQMLGVNLTIIGVIGNPLFHGYEKKYLELTNDIDFYVPLNTYLNLTSIALSPPYVGSLNVDVIKTIYVRVKEGYSVNEVAEKIREKFPGIGISTVEDERSWLRSATLQFLIQALVSYLLCGAVMLWSVKYREKEIFLFKALGWRITDILKFFAVRSVILGLFSSIIGPFLLLVTEILPVFAINLYIIYVILLTVPLLIPTVVLVVFIFSLPSIYLVYRLSSGEYLRG